MNIRLLKADEIDTRVQSVKEKGFALLLYKDARVDMNILDETFGIFGWKRSHELINGNLFCTISIWDNKNGQWVQKQDVGTESYTEKEKGQASDSFKRAAFNVGIGREIYTAPFIWINDKGDVNNNNGKLSVYTKFHVAEIGYDDSREINRLVIKDNKGKVRYQLGSSNRSTNQSTNQSTKKDEDLEAIKEGSLINPSQAKEIVDLMKAKKYTGESIISYIEMAYGKDDYKRLTVKQASEVIEMLKET